MADQIGARNHKQTLLSRNSDYLTHQLASSVMENSQSTVLNRRKDKINKLTSSRLPPPPPPPPPSGRRVIVRPVPLTILVTYLLVVVTRPLAAETDQRAIQSRNDDLLGTTRTAKTTGLEASGGTGLALRQNPLLNAGHLNRMYYAPVELDMRRAWAPSQPEDQMAPHDLRSPNNRGASLVLSRPSMKRPGSHRRSSQLEPVKLHFGERRSSRHKEILTANRRQDHAPPVSFPKSNNQDKFERRLMDGAPPSAAAAISWSQPDPRRFYSAPVSKVKLVHASSLRRNSAARRLYGGGRSSFSPRMRELMNRKEDSASNSLEAAAGLGTEASLSPPTSSGGANSAANVSSETNTGDFDLELLDGAGDSTQQQQPQPEDPNEISPNQWRSQPQAQKDQQSARLVTTGSQPLVTLIRYVPIIMNVPAGRLGAAPARQHNQQAAAANEPEAPGAAGGVPILASSSDHHAQQQVASGGSTNYLHAGSELFPIGGVPGLSSHEIQQALSGAGPADLHQLAHGGQPVFARLAYIPLSQPQVGGMPAGASHLTSKALAAYASKLISMLKPSHLLSSLGSSGGVGGPPQYQSQNHHQHHHQQQPSGMPNSHQILLFAPSTETLLAGAGLGAAGGGASTTGQVQPAAQPLRYTAASEPAAVRPPDLLINQASKVHSTKSQQQQQQRDRPRQQPPVQLKESQQQLPWPLMPQMNGLICVQGLIGAKPQKNQRQRQRKEPSQEQVDLSTFDDDDDYEPKKPAQQQVVAIKGQQRLPVGKSSVGGGGKGSASKFGKGPRADGGKESPIRTMQRKMAGKQRQDEHQQLQDFADFSQISQQKLLGLPSETKRDVFDGGRGISSGHTGGGNKATSSARSQTQPPASGAPATAAANFQPGDEIQSDARGRPIIPFTIRDKIDAPADRVRDQQRQTGGSSSSSGNNGPVQYDEPADEEPSENSGGGGASGEQRRSRTSFVASSPTGARRRGGQGGGVDISYRKEQVGQRDFSLPVLMASSTPRQRSPPPPASSSSVDGRRRAAIDRLDTPSQLGNSAQPNSPQYAALTPPGLSLSLHEPIGASSSSSSVSTTTTTATGSVETTTAPAAAAESALGTPTVTPPRDLARDSEIGARDESLGQLVSSVSLTGSGSASSSSTSSSRQAIMFGGAPTSTERPLATPANDTVELIVNSTPREAPITASPLQFTGSQQQQQHHLAPGKDRRAPLSGEQSDQMSTGSSSADDALLQMMSSNSFSHDRSLTPASERAGASYGRISESLQTNPLDLIDLQNSRSSFELPAQLESLSMLHKDDDDDENNNNHGRGIIQLVTQQDKQAGRKSEPTARARHQHQRAPESRVLQGALNATAPLT